jgi:1-deoxy-D-xylulose-5-phosphate synthase
MSISHLECDGTDEASGSVDVLGRIRGPGDLRGLSRDELTDLADAIRAFLVEKISVSGGHLGPNLGVVELTIALHRVFESPRDALIFDTGHQAYPHKLLTGRREGFDHLRAYGGLSGYPSRAESEHDWVESSHASAALSYADGLAKAFELSGQDRRVVAIVGDGALTGGMCWEALNNIAAGKSRHVVVVVNDNGRSYAPTIGGLADRLASLRMRPGYERLLASAKRELAAARSPHLLDTARHQGRLEGCPEPADVVFGLGHQVSRPDRRTRRRRAGEGPADGKGHRWSGHRPHRHP